MGTSAPPPPEAMTDSSVTAPDLLGSEAAGPVALRGSVLRGAAYAATIALSLISVPLLIRHLGIAGFGRYSIVMALVFVVTGITDAGLTNIAVREWVTHRGAERAQLFSSLLGVRVALSMAAAALAVCFALIASYPGVLVLGTLIAGSGVVFQTWAHLLSAPLQGDLRFGWVSLIDLSRQVVAVALIVVLVLAGAGLLPFFTVSIPSGIAMLLVAAVMVRGRVPVLPRLGTTDWWPLIRETLPYAAAMAVYTVYFRVTIIVMSLISSALQTGYFATAFRVVEVLIGFPGFAIATAFPILSRAAVSDRKRFIYATERIVELALIAGVALALCVVLAAPFVIDVLAGHRGAPAVRVLQIQGLALIATFVVLAASYALLALRRHAPLLIANLVALVANIGLTLGLVPADGARGGAIAAVVAEAGLALGLLVVLMRAGQIRVRVSTLVVVTVAGLAGATPLLVTGLHSVLRTLAGIAIYFAVITLLGRLPPELGHALQRGTRARRAEPRSNVGEA